MYVANRQGSASANGRVLRFDKGTEFDLPKGTLDHCPGLDWVKSTDRESELYKMKVPTLVEIAESLEIDVEGKKKKDLVEGILAMEGGEDENSDQDEGGEDEGK